MGLEVEFDEATGKIGTLPEPLQKMVDGLINQSHKTLRQQVADLEGKLKTTPSVDAAERERLRALEDENHRFKPAEAERKAEYEKALKIREEAEQKREDERKKADAIRQTEIEKRDKRLREMARSDIKIAAKRHGARDESLDELSDLLGARLDLDPDLQPFVKGADGKPAVDKDGKPVTIEGVVKEYLDSHTHHRAAAAGTGGGARGGASLSGADPTEVEKAQQDVEAAREDFRKSRGRDTAAGTRLLQANKALDLARQGKRAS